MGNSFLILFFLLALVDGWVCINVLDHKRYIFGWKKILFSFSLGTVLESDGILLLALLMRHVEWALYSSMLLQIIGILVYYVVKHPSLKTILRTVWHSVRHTKKRTLTDWFSYVGLTSIIAMLCIISLQAMVWKNGETPYGIKEGWGDAAFHLGMIQHLATVDPFILDQSIAGGEPLTYSFLINFISALFLRMGVSLPISWHLPLLLFAASSAVALYQIGAVWLKKKIFIIFFIFLVLCGSGLGFLWYGKQAMDRSPELGIRQALIEEFVHPSHRYTYLDAHNEIFKEKGVYAANIVWMAPINIFFSHQRSFFVGASISFFLLYGMWLYKNKQKQWFRWWLLIPLLPLAHIHSFIAIVIIIGTLFFSSLKKEKKYLLTHSRLILFVIGGVFLLTLPQLFFLTKGAITGSGFPLKLWFGWLMCWHEQSWFFCDKNIPGTDSNILWFWMKNFGVIFLGWLTAAIAVSWIPSLRKQIIYTLVVPSCALFILTNIFKFQPWAFDNNKILFYWWMLALLFILYWWEYVLARVRKMVIIFIPFILLASFAGIIDVGSRVRLGITSTDHLHYGYYTPQQAQIAQWVQTHTQPNDIILTCSAPNQYLSLIAGRSTYVGYGGWLWSHGDMPVWEHRKSITKKFLQSPTADITQLCEEGVRYWLRDNCFTQQFEQTQEQSDVSERIQKNSLIERMPVKEDFYQLHCNTL
ncbi:MAG TPA: hypothetical protein VJB65_03035 [Patescibacteria group bacterium]|nr:hypothetical protein [Patescibacteria group bacterium]